MKNKKILGIILLVVGAVLIYYGIDQLNSFGSKFNKAFGETDFVSIGSIVFGAILALLGIRSILKGK